MANLSDCEEEGCLCKAANAFAEPAGQQNRKEVEVSQPRAARYTRTIEFPYLPMAERGVGRIYRLDGEAEEDSEVSATLPALFDIPSSCVNITPIRDRPLCLSLCVSLKPVAGEEHRARPDGNVSA